MFIHHQPLWSPSRGRLYVPSAQYDGLASSHTAASQQPADLRWRQWAFLKAHSPRCYSDEPTLCTVSAYCSIDPFTWPWTALLAYTVAIIHYAESTSTCCQSIGPSCVCVGSITCFMQILVYTIGTRKIRISCMSSVFAMIVNSSEPDWDTF